MDVLHEHKLVQHLKCIVYVMFKFKSEHTHLKLYTGVNILNCDWFDLSHDIAIAIKQVTKLLVFRNILNFKCYLLRTAHNTDQTPFIRVFRLVL